MEIKRPLKNMISMSAADVASRLLGFAATAYLARVLGTSSFGTVSVGFSILGYILWFSSPGLQVMGTREVAAGRSSDGAWISGLLSLRFFLAILGIFLVGGIGYVFYGTSMEWITVVLFGFSAMPLAWSLDWYFQGREELGVMAAGRILMSSSYLVMILLLVSRPEHTLWTAICFFGGNVVAALWLSLRFRSTGEKLSLSFSPSQWVPMLKESISMGISSLLAQTIMNIPVLLVAGLLSARDTGLISAPLKLVFFLLMVDRVFYMLYFPVITRQHATGRNAFARLVTLGMKIVLAVSVPMFVTGIAVSPMVVSRVFGEHYGEAVPALRLLLPFFLFTTSSTVLMCALYADNRAREYLKAMAIGTTVLLVSGIVLTNLYGILGTSISLSATEALITVLLFVRVRKIAELRFFSTFGPALGAGAVMAGVIMLAAGGPLFLIVPLAFLCFAGILLLLGGLTRDDLRYLKERFV